MSEAHETNTKGKTGRWICTVCGHIYDPSTGDPARGVAPGTPFEALPEDWRCPVCGVGKALFEPEER